MAKAIWNGELIAESDDTVVVEGNLYFSPQSIKKEFFIENNKQSVCPWKGTASYYDIVVDGKTNTAAAWYYPSPKPAAKQIADRIAFWKGVKVES